jgi:hypothetical protein
MTITDRPTISETDPRMPREVSRFAPPARRVETERPPRLADEPVEAFDGPLRDLERTIAKPEHGVAVGVSDLKFHQLIAVATGILRKLYRNGESGDNISSSSAGGRCVIRASDGSLSYGPDSVGSAGVATPATPERIEPHELAAAMSAWALEKRSLPDSDHKG